MTELRLASVSYNGGVDGSDGRNGDDGDGDVNCDDN